MLILYVYMCGEFDMLILYVYMCGGFDMCVCALMHACVLVCVCVDRCECGEWVCVLLNCWTLGNAHTV